MSSREGGEKKVRIEYMKCLFSSRHKRRLMLKQQRSWRVRQIRRSRRRERQERRENMESRWRWRSRGDREEQGEMGGAGEEVG